MAEGERRLLAILFTDIVGYTALVGDDEARGIEARREHRRLLQTLASQFRGEFVDESGDAALSIFPSAVDAVRCALAIQAVLASDPAFQVRVGLHVGDVVEQEGRLVGDGINVASRLPALAEPGGIVASDRVVEHLRNQRIETRPLGRKQLKNVAEAVPVFAVSGRPAKPGGSRRRRAVAALAGALLLVALGVFLARGGLVELVVLAWNLGLLKPGPSYEQELAFTETSDGLRLAWASVGEGPPIVLVLGWFTHIEQGGNSPGRNPWVMGLVDRHRIVLYDGRGSGLSDRGVSDFSLEAKLRDLEAVVAAAGLERFGLYAISAGGPTSLAYAARHPERVTRLAFYGSFAHLGCKPAHLERWRALVPAVRVGWGEDNPAFRQLFTSLFMPDGDELDRRLFNEFQRISATPEDAARFIDSLIETDVREEARRVRAPVLVTHLRDDQIVPFECGREIAALVPGARLHGIEGRNHALVSDAATEELSETVAAFFAEDLPASARP